jgi:hypothetical protein
MAQEAKFAAALMTRFHDALSLSNNHLESSNHRSQEKSAKQ